MNYFIPVRVAQIQQITPVIRQLSFEGVDADLLPFSSGSHVVVQLPLADRLIQNAYSLLNDPYDTQQYHIAVRLQEHSRGGSQYVHQQLREGDVLNISAPLNLFSLNSQASHHVLIAGGIGITPFMSHMKYLLHIGASFELHYACRAGVSDAYSEVLTQLFADRVHIYSEKTAQRLDVDALLAKQSLHSHVYICGPDRLIDAVKHSASTLGWSSKRVHWEAFSSPNAGTAFDVQLNNGRRIHVPSDFSMLEALEQADIEIPNLCRGGVCGQCSTAYHAGEVDHLDHFLTVQEQQRYVMPCVSRSKDSQCLFLDL